MVHTGTMGIILLVRGSLSGPLWFRLLKKAVEYDKIASRREGYTCRIISGEEVSP